MQSLRQEYYSERKTQVDQHVKTALHKERLKNFASMTQQLFLSEKNAEKPKEEFNHELAKAFLAADIQGVLREAIQLIFKITLKNKLHKFISYKCFIQGWEL